MIPEAPKLSQAELSELLTETTGRVHVGGRYRHYKQKDYHVLMVAILEATNEPCIIYQADYGDRITFIRPVSDWLASVEVDGKTVPRFTRLPDES